MDQDSNKAPASGGSSTNPLVLLVTLLAGGLLVHQLPLFDSRPTAPEPKAYSYIAANRIDARLWQDPIEAVARGIKDIPLPSAGTPAAKDADSSEKTAAPLRNWLRENSVSQPLVLGVVVPGGSYSGYSEWRRKARYAVLSGLAAKGFTPTDPEHLEFFRLDADLRDKIDRDGKGNSIEARFVAYEWLDAVPAGNPRSGETSPAPPAGGHKSGERRVVVIWLDEDMFWTKPVQGIDAMFGFLFNLSPKPSDTSRANKKNVNDDGRKPRVTILGPGDSTVLQHMVAEAANASQNLRQVDLSFYDYAATATDAELLEGVGSNGDAPTLGKIFQKPNPVVFRTISDDRSLACALRDELALRGIAVPVLNPDPPRTTPLPDEFAAPEVVLISEWDTTYGRALSGVTRDVIAGSIGCDGSAAVVRRRFTPDLVHDMHWLRTYTYLRGLDGRLPDRAGDSKSTSGASTDASAGTKSSPSSATSDDKGIERAQGQSQLDYLRRLAMKLREMDQNARRLDQPGIRAIGVLGSDVYDKLIVLQALRPSFPNVVFFTTDLDARLLHPQELDWTRNLLVASSFGLDLAPAVQTGVPPFRDVYETSLFLTTLVALNNADAPKEPCVGGNVGSSREGAIAASRCTITQAQIDVWRKQPRMFEIGRHGPFDLSKNVVDQSQKTACGADALGSCATVFPAAPALVPARNPGAWRLTTLAAILGIVALALAGGAGTRFHAWAAKQHPTWSTTDKPLVIVVALIGVGLFAAFAYALPNIFQSVALYLTQNGEGVPMTLLDGVSIWPTELIRSFALVLALFLTWYGWRKLEHNVKHVSSEMKWESKRRELEREVNKDYRAWGKWQRYLHVFSYQLDADVTAKIRADAVAAGSGAAQGAINPNTGLRPEAEAFWRSYIYQNRVVARLCRIATAIGLYFVFATAVVAVFGFPDVAIRGARAATIDKGLVLVAVLAMLFLTFFVVDATLLCRQFVIAISSRRRVDERAVVPDDFDAITDYTRWPIDTLKHFAKKLELDMRYVDQWVTIHVIGLRTDAVSRLIYYPYIIISLVIVARSSIFDNWSMPVSLIIILGTSVVVVTISAIMLRMAAEYARRKAIWRLTNEQVRLNSGGEAQQRTSKQLDLLIQQIRRYDTGSFASYLEQPLLRAVMLPLGSFGGVGLLQYLSIFNL